MRADQFIKLQDLAEKLTDAFIAEADPDTWPGAGLGPAAMDQQTRGDRYWCKKNAAATLSVIVRTTSLIGIIQQHSNAGRPGGVPAPADAEQEDSGMDAEIKSAEKEATKLLAKMQKSMQNANGK